METNIVTLVGFACTLVGNYFIYLKRSKEDSIERVKSEQKQNDRLDEIDKKLDEHNGYAKLYRDTAVDIRIMKSDIQNLKEDIKNVKMCKIK